MGESLNVDATPESHELTSIRCFSEEAWCVKRALSPSAASFANLENSNW
jgi:hypothetical protein